MKFLIIFCTLCLMSSCGTSSEAAEEAAEVILDGIKVFGTVQVNENGCPLYIEAVEDGTLTRMYPVNLDNQFKVDGNNITFNYSISKAKQPAGCSVDKVVALTDVTKVD